MSTVKFECALCSGFKTKKYNGWRKHLVGEGHQVQVRERIEGFPLKDKERCAVVFGVRLVKETAVLKYFGDLAVVSNFVYWTERKDFCILQFLRRSFRNTVFSKSHTINGHEVVLRAREEISDIEWLSIGPFVLPEIKMEVDDQPDDVFRETGEESEFVDVETYDSEDSCRTTLLVTNRNNDEEMDLNVDQDLEERAPSRSVALYSSERDNIVDNFRGTVNPPVNNDAEQAQDKGSSPILVPSEGNGDEDVDGKIVQPTFVPRGSDRPVVQSTPSTNEDNDMDDLSNFHGTYNEPAEKEMEDVSPISDPNEGNTGEGDEEDYPYAEVPGQEQLGRDLNDRFEFFYSANLVPPGEWIAQRRVIASLQKLLQGKYPRAIVLPFGAGVTALSSIREPFSVFIDMLGLTATGSRDESQSIEVQINFIGMLVRFFKSVDSSLIFDLTVTLNPVTNIQENIIFTFAEENMKCKLLTNNFLHVQCSRLVGFLSSLDSRVRPLLVIARYWSSAYRLTQSHPKVGRRRDEHFYPEVIEWLVLTYLAVRRIIPSVSAIQEIPCRRLYLQMANVAFCNNQEELTWNKCTASYEVDSSTGNPSACSMLKLASEMFAYYGGIKYDRRCISAYRAKNYLRKAYRFQHLFMELEFKSLCKLIRANMETPMIVQNPLILCINKTRNVSSEVVADFKAGCINSCRNIEFMLQLQGETLKEPLDVLTPKLVSELECERLFPRTPSCNLAKTKPNVDSNIKQKFTFVLKVTKEFREKAKLVTSPPFKKFLKDSLFDVWQIMTYQFNERVWPLCFGVQLRLKRINDDNVHLQVYKGKGVLVDPGKIIWINKMIAEGILTEDNPAFLRQLGVLRSLLLQDESDSILLTDESSSNESWKFRIRLSSFSGKTTRSGRVEVDFSNVRGTVISSETEIGLFKKMYEMLWNAYYLHRLSKEYLLSEL